MKYRYREKAYEYGSYQLIPMEPGDEWYDVGGVRVQLPALLIDIENHPEQFTSGRILVASYEAQANAYEEQYETIGIYEEDEDVTEPLIVMEYGPDEWQVIDGWLRICAAKRMGLEWLPAVKVSSDQIMRYLVDESDIRHYIEYWNYKAAYWERRDRINGFLQEDRPEYTQIHVDAERTWQAIQKAAGRGHVELPIRWNRWFSIHGDGNKVILGEAKYMAPGCALTFDRPVRQKEFMEIFSFYEEWEMTADEEIIREKARRISISYEYIFSMIRQYAVEKKYDILSAKPYET